MSRSQQRSLRPPSSSSSSSSVELELTKDPDLDPDLPHAIARLINSHGALDSALSGLIPRLTPSALLCALGLVSTPAAALRLFRWAQPLLPSLLSDRRPAAKTLHLLLRSRDPRPALHFALSLPPSSLADHSFNALLRSLSRAGHLRSSLSLFRLLPSPSAFSFNSLLAALLRRGRTRAARSLFDEMLHRAPAVRPDACTFNTLIRGLCLNSMPAEAFRLFREMPRHGCQPDLVTYNTLLDGLCRAGELHAARGLLDAMRTKSSDLAPNVVSYTTLIRGYCGRLLPAEAVGVFEQMVAVGVKPNRITYNTLIQGLCEAKRMDLGKEILEQGNGANGDSTFRPDTCTFNILIASHCKMGRVGEALKMFDRMPELKVKADSATYSTLIRGLCQSGEFGRAEELVDELLEKEVLRRRGGCVPLMAAYNPICEYLCNNGKAEKARRLFQQLLDRRATVDVGAFKTLISGHCREGAFKEGYELLVSMVKRDLVPDVETYEALVVGFLGNGKVDYAFKALERMLDSGHRPSTATFHSVLAGLLEKDYCAEEAGKLVAVMIERKIRQSINLSTDVMANLFSNGLSDRAFEIVRLLYDNGYYVKMEKLAGSLCQGKKFLEARELLLFSLEKSQELDSKVYGTVISGLCVSGKAPEAFGLFYKMIDKKSATVPSNCLVSLKAALEESRKWKEAEFVWKQMCHANSESVNCN
ncbi:pentatricopeptide repeat-containing protein At1g02060, chloroplastic [Phoenix dactylifera]|uniref:Pentatricopeptide repeat-containing protein At1g02060, chloroplastic n=1 Tax=Phoenix dactylifera TaxID=42345 RepID=A0A8B8J005_PHODC|nr:pentatricopeptide repeat-containing protein At1g02060, chloroplastic [Phoenix dactylifera]